MLQSEYNLLERSVEREVLPYCRAHRVGFVPYHPLAGGFLTGKYERESHRQRAPVARETVTSSDA